VENLKGFSHQRQCRKCRVPYCRRTWENAKTPNYCGHYCA